MRYPTLPTRPGSRETVEVFRGYNHTLRPGTGEFYHMENLTSDAFPVLSPRGKRGIYARTASPQGIIAKEQVCYVDGADFVIGTERIAMGLGTAPADCPKKLVSMGAYVIILPDKMYINTANPADFGCIEQRNTAANPSFTLCDGSGGIYEQVTVSGSAPASPENGSCWIDTSGETHTLKRYGAGGWTVIPATYIRIQAPGIGKGLRRYDGVTLSGITAEGAEQLNGSAVVWDCGEDYIVVPGLLERAAEQEAAVTAARVMPELDYIIESENRLWGCRYGTAADGQPVNEIYACKLGDFRNWSCFMGLSTDSYAASCGTDGPFTGAVTHLGHPLFFKEHCVHKVYGSSPESFEIQTTACRGVQKGSHGSLAIVGETLFYKARSAVCAYDGSLPVEVSQPLGSTAYSDAVGGAHGNKYYISMGDDRGQWHLFVYDTARNMWHREDSLRAGGFCSWMGEMYCVDAGSRNILTLLGTGESYEAQVAWEAETGDLGLNSPDMKYVSRLLLRLMLEPDAMLDVSIQYDMDPGWIHLCNIRGTDLRSFTVPVIPRRSDHIKLKLVGIGGAKLYGITKVIQEGSDRS